MATIPQVAGVVQEILGPVAERAARATGFVQRASKLTGARFVQTLVFGWLAQPEARLSQLAQTAATLGVPISPQALDERFGVASAECLREVLEAAVRVVVAADPVAVPVLQRFAAVAVQDCTTIALPAALAAVWPGCGGSTPASGAAALKLGVRLDLVSGRLSGPYRRGRADGRPRRRRRRPAAAARRAAPRRPGLLQPGRAGRAGRQRCPWLSRWQPGTALYTPDGERHEVLALLAAATGAHAGSAGAARGAPAPARPAAGGARAAGGRRPAPPPPARGRPGQGPRGERRPTGLVRLDRARDQRPRRATDAARGAGARPRPLADRAPVQALEEPPARGRVALGQPLAHPHRGRRQAAGRAASSTGSCWSAAGTTPTAAWSRPPRPSRPTRSTWPPPSTPTRRSVHALHTVARCLAAAARLNTRRAAPSTAQLLLALDAATLA